MEILCVVLGIYTIVLFVRILSSWFPPPRPGPLRALLDVVYALTDPVLRPLRSLIPPARMGAMAIDFSPIIVFVILAVLRTALGCRGLIV
jgi:YggT family protein